MFSAVHFSLFLLLKTNLIDLRVLDEIYQLLRITQAYDLKGQFSIARGKERYEGNRKQLNCYGLQPMDWNLYIKKQGFSQIFYPISPAIELEVGYSILDIDYFRAE